MGKTPNSDSKSNVDVERIFREKLQSVMGNKYIKYVLNFSDLGPEEFKEANEKIRKFVESISGREKVTSTKMRKIYQRIKDSKDINDLLFQIPYLAYMVGRESEEAKESLGQLYILLKEAIEKAEEKHVKNIKKFAEALVAYQKFYEGTTKKEGKNE